MTDNLVRLKPSEFCEKERYLTSSVTSMPGPMSYDATPIWREIVDCFDVDSPVREVNVKKAVQVGYTTAVIESGMFYYICHVKRLPQLYMTADKELATSRMENNVLVMLRDSGKNHVIRSSDIGNKRKTGKTKDHLQHEGGGFIIPFGAKNADKMRQLSAAIIWKDELDAWLQYIGNDGCPDLVSDDRKAAFEPDNYKISRGSTPLIRGISKIDKQYLRGDQRKYHVRCLSCGIPQELRWTGKRDNGKPFGIIWETQDNGILIPESVRYVCKNCGHQHHEHDKEKLFAPDQGAEWVPTSEPVEPNIRSYHVTGMMATPGQRPWWKLVSIYKEGFDEKTKQIIDMGKYQVFYNNVLAKSFEVKGSKVTYEAVSGHRRHSYNYGQIPDKYAEKYTGSKILFLTCQVDVHDRFLSVAVMGWTEGFRCFLIDYHRLEEPDKEITCGSTVSSVWGELTKIIEERVYVTDDKREKRVIMTLIDAGYENDTVCNYANNFTDSVYPIVGREKPAKNQSIKEFGEFTTQIGTTGYKITVDHYKDRLAPVLRREWIEENGIQGNYHFNAPVDITKDSLEELTAEKRVKETDKRGNVTHRWYRTGRNELWDLLIYGHAAVEILAWQICVQTFKQETVDWEWFWNYIGENAA